MMKRKAIPQLPFRTPFLALARSPVLAVPRVQLDPVHFIFNFLSNLNKMHSSQRAFPVLLFPSWES